MKDIIRHLGTQDFARIRIGVGEKPKGWDLADHVLARFAHGEEPVIREALGLAVDACREIVNEGIDSAMNKFNHH